MATTPRVVLAIATLVVLALSCGRTPTDPSAPTESPRPTRSATPPVASGLADSAPPPRDRELTQLPAARKLSGPEGAWSLAAPSLSELTLDEGRFSLDIGTEADVQCEFQPARYEAAALVDAAFSGKGHIDSNWTHVAAYRVEATPGVALLGVRGVSSAPNASSAETPLEFEVVVAVHPEWSLSCQHDELGYGQTLVRIVRQIAVSVQTRARSRTHYGAVWRIERDGKLVGVEQLVDQVAGSQRTLHLSRDLVFPRGDRLDHRTLSTTQKIDASGGLLAEETVTVVNRTPRVVVELTRAAPGSYRVKGFGVDKSDDQRAVDVGLRTTGRTSLRGIIAELQQIQTRLGAQPSYGFERFAATETASALTRVEATVIPDHQGYSIELGGRSTRVIVDSLGMVVRREARLADGTVETTERVATHGTP